MLYEKVEKKWNEFTNLENNSWLKTILDYNDTFKQYNLYFTKIGYNMFIAKILPLIVKFIDQKLMEVETIEIAKENIVEGNQYQIVTKNNMSANKIMNLMENIECGFLNEQNENIFL